MTFLAGIRGPERFGPGAPTAQTPLNSYRALEATRTLAADVEYWPTPDPTGAEGSREQRLDAYREVREMLTRRIRERFARPMSGNE